MNLDAKETFITTYSLVLGFVIGVLNQADNLPRFVTLVTLLIGLIIQRIIIWVNWEEK